MFVDKRRIGKSIKYYLVHSYRVGTSVKRISRYLGSNLDQKTLEKLRIGAEKIILEQVHKSPYESELDIASINKFKAYDTKLDIVHLQKVDWDRFTKEFTYNTNAIEGSTVALKEVEDLVNKREKPQNYDELETINVAKAVEYIRTTKDAFSIEFMLKLHKLCFDGTKNFAGKLRNVDVVIRDSLGNVVHQGASHHVIPKLLKELVKWYNSHQNKYPPLLLAALTHNEFENIHPFQDGNGRVGRLLLNYVLLKHNYPPINITLKDRKRYYQVLQDYEKIGDIKSTLKFLISQYKVSTKTRK
jgi:Fic family protein